VVGGEQRDEPILRGVDVLILIHEHVLEALLILLAGCFVALEQVDRANDEIVEIQRVRLGEPALILGVNVGDPLAGKGRLALRVLFGPNQRVLRFIDLGEAGARREMPFVIIEVVQNLFDELPLIRFIDHRETTADADSRTIATQNANAHRVKGSDPEVAGDRTDHGMQPRLHLAGSLVGERYRKNAFGSDS
jgi:hypothetical protein